MPESTFWHLQLHPNDRLGPEKTLQILEETGLIGLSDYKGGADYRDFKSVMKIGDIVLVREGKTPLALVEVTGQFQDINNPNQELDWFKQRRKIRILEIAAADRGDFPKHMGTLERLVGNTASRRYIEEWYKSIRGEHMNDNEISLLKANLQMILTGPPGTGKTYMARQMACQIIGCNLEALDANDRFRFVQFHSSYDYSDFVEGLKPELVDGQVRLILKSGRFMEFCLMASQKPDQEFVFVIDEINRADLSRVFGELFFAIESGYRGAPIDTQYSYISGMKFTVPKNVFIIGTMNDIDRSVESIDFALRRRFAWVEINADESLFERIAKKPLGPLYPEAQKSYLSLNAKIRETQNLGKAYQIGPAYFLKLKEYKEDSFGALWNYHLQVLIREYLRGFPDAPEVEASLRDAFFA